MSEPLIAAVLVFAFGVFAGIAIVGGSAQATRAASRLPRSSSPAPVSTKRSRAIHLRLTALESAVPVAEPPARPRARPQRPPYVTADAEELSALLALGIGRREARARIAAIPADLATVEARVAAALRVTGWGQ